MSCQGKLNVKPPQNGGAHLCRRAVRCSNQVGNRRVSSSSNDDLSDEEKCAMPDADTQDGDADDSQDSDDSDCNGVDDSDDEEHDGGRRRNLDDFDEDDNGDERLDNEDIDVQKMDEWLKQRSDSLSSIEFENEMKPGEDVYELINKHPTRPMSELAPFINSINVRELDHLANVEVSKNDVTHDHRGKEDKSPFSYNAKPYTSSNSQSVPENEEEPPRSKLACKNSSINKRSACTIKKKYKLEERSGKTQRGSLHRSKRKGSMIPLQFREPDRDNMLMTPQELEMMPESGLEFEESVGPREATPTSQELEEQPKGESSDEAAIGLDLEVYPANPEDEAELTRASSTNGNDEPSGSAALTTISISSDKATNTTSIVINTPQGQKTYKINTSNLVHAAALQPASAINIVGQRLVAPVGASHSDVKRDSAILAINDAESGENGDDGCEGLAIMATTSSGKERKLWKCPDESCHQVYTKYCKLKVHIMHHSGLRPFRCDVDGCDWAFTTDYKLRRHLETHIGKKDYKCDVAGCNSRFTTIYNLNTHKKLHNQPHLVQCPVDSCCLKFQTRRKMELHMKEHAEVEAPYKCPFENCGKTYYTANSMASHLRVHQKSDLRCSIDGCGKVFDKASRLKQHMWQHTGERPYVCEFEGCGWAFVSASKLKRHVRKHTGERKYICPEEGCGKSFMRLEHLQGHLVVHSGNKPFECPHKSCKARFTAKSSLYVHMKKHNGLTEKLIYPCPIDNCDKKYNCKSSLRLHMLRYHTPVLADAGHLDYITLLPNDNFHEMVAIENPAQEIFTRGAISSSGATEESAGSAGDCTFLGNPEYITQAGDVMSTAGSGIVTQYVLNGICPNLTAVTSTSSAAVEQSSNAEMEVLPTSRVSQENNSGSARTDYCSNHVLISRAKKRKKVQQQADSAQKCELGEHSLLNRETPTNLMPSDVVLSSTGIAFRDPLTGVDFIQAQLLQDDPPSKGIVYQEDALLSSVSVSHNSLVSELTVSGSLLNETAACVDGVIEATTSHGQDFTNASVSGTTEFTGTTINMRDLE